MQGYSVFRVSTGSKDEEIFWGGECRTSCGCFSGVAPTIMVSLFLRIRQGEDPLEIAELFIFDL
jgi:hypothetical protein